MTLGFKYVSTDEGRADLASGGVLLVGAQPSLIGRT